MCLLLELILQRRNIYYPHGVNIFLSRNFRLERAIATFALHYGKTRIEENVSWISNQGRYILR